LHAKLNIAMTAIEHTFIGRDSAHPLKIPRIIAGLWQLAGGHDTDVNVRAAAEEMGELVGRGLTGFDMADRTSLGY